MPVNVDGDRAAFHAYRILMHGCLSGVASLILYEPVMAPFGQEQVRPSREVREREDFDAMVEIVNRDISGYTQEHVDALRSDATSWAPLLVGDSFGGRDRGAERVYA